MTIIEVLVSSGGLAVKHPALDANGHTGSNPVTFPEINFSAHNIVGG